MVNVKQEVRLREAATKKYLALKSQSMKEMKNIPEIELADRLERRMEDLMTDMKVDRRMEMEDMMMEERRFEEDNRRLEEDHRRLEEDHRRLEEDHRRLEEEEHIQCICAEQTDDMIQRICAEQTDDMLSTENHVLQMEDTIEDIMKKMKTTEINVMQMEEEMDHLNQLIRNEEKALTEQLVEGKESIRHTKNHRRTTTTATTPMQEEFAEQRHVKESSEQPRYAEHTWKTPEASPQQLAHDKRADDERSRSHARPTPDVPAEERPLPVENTRTTRYSRVLLETEDEMKMNVKKLVKEREDHGDKILDCRDKEEGYTWDRDLYKMTQRIEEEMKMMVNVRQLIRQREAMKGPLSTDPNETECDPLLGGADNYYPVHRPGEDDFQGMLCHDNVYPPENNVKVENSYNVSQPEENLQDTRYNNSAYQSVDNIQSIQYNGHDHQPGANVNSQRPCSRGRPEQEQRGEEQVGTAGEERPPRVSPGQNEDTNRIKTPEGKGAEVEDVTDKTNAKRYLLTEQKKLQYIKRPRRPVWPTRTTEQEDLTPMVNVRLMIQKREEAWQQVLAAEEKHQEMLRLLRRTAYIRGSPMNRTPYVGSPTDRSQTPGSSMSEGEDSPRSPAASPVEVKCQEMEETVKMTMAHMAELIKEEDDMEQERDHAEQTVKDLEQAIAQTELDVKKMEDQVKEIKDERKEEMYKWEVDRHREEEEDLDSEEDDEEYEEDTSASPTSTPTSPRPWSTSPTSRSPSPRLTPTSPRPRSTPPRSRSPSPRPRSPSPRPRSPSPRSRSPSPRPPISSVVSLFRDEQAVEKQIQGKEENLRLMRDEMTITQDKHRQMEQKMKTIKQERKEEEQKWEKEKQHLKVLEAEIVGERRTSEEGGQTEVLSHNQTRAIFSHYCPLTLDPNTANKHLFLGENNTMATRVKEKQPYVDHPDRFDYWSQVVCREGLTGRCYWEIDWRKQVSIAVAYSGITRRGLSDGCLFGHNANSWSLEGYNIPTSVYGLQGARYIVRHNRIKTQLPILPTGTNRVGVYLDYPAGTLSFYTVCSDTRTHLHTFQTRFTEPLYAAFWCPMLDSSVTLCRREDIR